MRGRGVDRSETDFLNFIKQWMFYMRSVPTEGLHAVSFCGHCEYIPSFPIGARPIPARKRSTVAPGELACLVCGQVWDEVDGESELMRGLPRSRFRSAFGQKLSLPAGEAQRLEDFEAELHVLGLIKANQIVVDIHGDGTELRVEKRDHRDAAFRDTRRVQGNLHGQAQGTERPLAASPAALGRGSRVKGLSVAPLETGETLVRQGSSSTHLCENTRDSGPREARTCIHMHK